MREFKFRVFDYDNAHMIIFNSFRMMVKNNASLMLFQFGTVNGQESFISFGGKLSPLMQYTGLKDRNGLEIYEGDILGQFSVDGKILGKYIVEAKMEKSCGCCSTVFGWDIGDPEHEEVIGNIYQHPELLNKEQT